MSFLIENSNNEITEKSNYIVKVFKPYNFYYFTDNLLNFQNFSITSKSFFNTLNYF